MKTKFILGGVAALFIIGLAGAAFWCCWRPQVITLSDGSKLTLLAVDYGRKHAPPNVKTSGGKTPGRRDGSFTTTNDLLVVWVRQQYDSKEFHNFQYFAYDLAGTACVSAGYGNGGGQQGDEVVGLRLDGFPRRQGKFVLRVLENSNGGQEIADQRFIIHNPARGEFASWTPARLPNTQEDEDLAVTLTKLAAGAAMPYTRNNSDADDAMNKGVQATFQVARNGQSVTNWEPVGVETWDASGNHVYAIIAGGNGRALRADKHWNGPDDTVIYQYGLWPDEPAWKLRFEFSQQAGFADSELWSVPAVPLQPGRQQDFMNLGRRKGAAMAGGAEADLNGLHLKVFPVLRFTNLPPNMPLTGGLVVQVTPRLSPGMRLTLVSLTDDQTNDIEYYNGAVLNGGPASEGGTTCRYRLRDLGDATNLNLTLALHRSRFVEFTAKPEKAPAAAQP